MAALCMATATLTPSLGKRSYRARAILHGCVIGRDALVGMNSVIMDGAVIGEESIVAAMSFVKAGFRGEKRQLLMGTPARAVRSVSDDELHWKRLNTKEYQILSGAVMHRYMKRSH